MLKEVAVVDPAVVEDLVAVVQGGTTNLLQTPDQMDDWCAKSAASKVMEH